MKEQIRRILELVQKGRLPEEDALSLLSALNARLSLNEAEQHFIFGSLKGEDASVERLTDTLLAMKGLMDTPPNPPYPPRPPKGGSWNFEGLEDLGQRISSAVEGAVSGAFPATRPGRPGTILRVEVEDENGGSFNANLPLSLADHAHKLLPPRALDAIAHAGMEPDALILLLKSNPPIGPLIESEDENGNEVRLTVK